MKKRERVISWCVVFLVFSTFGYVQATAHLMDFSVPSSNKAIYIGSASIWGNGTASRLDANVENNLVIKIDAQSEIVDLFIDYDISCESLTDEGVVTLSLYRDDQNISWNLTQSPTAKSGSLYLRDIEVNRGDSFLVTITVVYGNIVPVYHNETSDVNAAIVPKYKIMYHPFFQSYVSLWTYLLQCVDEMRNCLF